MISDNGKVTVMIMARITVLVMTANDKHELLMIV
jgi:hypothetical protein